MNPYTRFLITLILLFLVTDVDSRPELGPPSIQLRANTSVTAVATLVEVTDQYTLVFEAAEFLHGEIEPLFEVASDPVTSASLKLGRSYIVSFSPWEMKRFPRRISLRGGPGMVSNIPGATPAIFAYSPLIQRMLEVSVEESRTSPAWMLEVLFEGLGQSSDPHTQNFFLVELLTRTSLGSAMSIKQKAELYDLFASSDTSPQMRQFLLIDGQVAGMAKSAHAHRKVIESILQHYPLDVDSASSDASFIRSLLRQYALDYKRPNYDIVSRWLHSSTTPLLDLSINLLMKQDKVRLLEDLNQLKQQTLIKPSNQRLIEQGLRVLKNDVRR